VGDNPPKTKFLATPVFTLKLERCLSLDTFSTTGGTPLNFEYIECTPTFGSLELEGLIIITINVNFNKLHPLLLGERPCQPLRQFPPTPDKTFGASLLSMLALC
jgi:hypothetical protein